MEGASLGLEEAGGQGHGRPRPVSYPLCNEAPQTSHLKMTHAYHFTFLWVSRRSLLSWFSASGVSPGCNPGIGQAAFSSEDLTGEGSAPKLIHVVGRIQFLGVIGPKAVQYCKVSLHFSSM